MTAAALLLFRENFCELILSSLDAIPLSSVCIIISEIKSYLCQVEVSKSCGMYPGPKWVAFFGIDVRIYAF